MSGEYSNPVNVVDAVDELDRMARETARDAYRTAIFLLQQGGGAQTFGVQHVGGRILLTVSVGDD